MKKTLFGLLVVLIFAPGVKAQEFNAQKAYKDYVFQYQQYSDVHQEYVVAKNAYLQNPTLNLQTQASVKTAKMLVSRDQAVATYLTALRLTLVETKGYSNEKKAPLFALLDEEITWWQQRENVYSEQDSLTDLTNKSLAAKSRWQTDTQEVVYRTLYAIGNSDTRFLLAQERQTLVDLRNLVNRIAQEGVKKTAKLEQWFFEIEDRFVKSEGAEKQANQTIAGLETRYRNRKAVYTNAISELEVGFTPLVEALNFFGEIIREIKTVD